MIILTKNGKHKISNFIEECKAKRKKILDARLDTCSIPLPTEEDILCDMSSFISKDGEYYNSWGVTDNYNSDYPLCLEIKKDFVTSSMITVKLYKCYQLEWMIRHGIFVNDLFSSLIDNFENHLKYSKDEIEQEVVNFFDEGFNGEMWVCYDEFCDCELRCPDYILKLMELGNFTKEETEWVKKYLVDE